jgi:sodium/hydrogen exchanger-like protein 6/7
MKHYAYFNMSRRTQLTTKYFFQVTASLSENFIFIYLGLALFTDKNLVFQPLLIIVTVLAVCAARWLAVFPLSKAINWFIRYRAQRRGREAADELPYSYQVMLFWAGLRGAVGVALSALFKAKESAALQATVLVVVVLTVIIFGGTTARMLEILGIRTGVTEDNDSDDEFDIEAVGGGVYKRTDTAIGYTARGHRSRGSAVPLNNVGNGRSASGGGSASNSASGDRNGGWASGHRSPNTAAVPHRQNSRSRKAKGTDDYERSGLLGTPVSGSNSDSELASDIDISDLPPPAPAPRSRSSPMLAPPEDRGAVQREPGGAQQPQQAPLTATAAIRQLLRAEDPSALLRQLDEDFIKPHLLLDGGNGRGSGAH